MGTQKVLLPFAGRTVVGHIAGEILRSPVAEAIVVVGPDAPCIAEALPASRVRLVPNPDADGDMLSSVRCGLRALPSDCEAVLVALGDQPSITADLVGRMIDAFDSPAACADGSPPGPSTATCRAGCPRTGRAGRGIVVPVYGGRPGHPILFSARYREEVLTRYDGVGLCGLRQAHPEDVFELGVTTPSVLADMDWPEDYRRELAEFRPGPSPDRPEC
jgi:molybdenum cofactor cytidylyltransferase